MSGAWSNDRLRCRNPDCARSFGGPVAFCPFCGREQTVAPPKPAVVHRPPATVAPPVPVDLKPAATSVPPVMTVPLIPTGRPLPPKTPPVREVEVSQPNSVWLPLAGKRRRWWPFARARRAPMPARRRRRPADVAAVLLLLAVIVAIKEGHALWSLAGLDEAGPASPVAGSAALQPQALPRWPGPGTLRMPAERLGKTVLTVSPRGLSAAIPVRAGSQAVIVSAGRIRAFLPGRIVDLAPGRAVLPIWAPGAIRFISLDAVELTVSVETYR